MKSLIISALLAPSVCALPADHASLVKNAAQAISSVVSGTPMGFASTVTGGGTAAPVHPTTVQQLISYLKSSEPQVIVISGTFDFHGTEGKATYQACDAYPCTPSNGGQALLNTLKGCGSKPTYSVSLDKAGIRGIDVKSDKTLVGADSTATLDGKGLSFRGVSNIIIQNIHITNLNTEYVWGGDAITISDSSRIWIDHVTTSLTGRQHYSFGTGASSAITISNSFLNGKTPNSASCDGHTYWGLELVGSEDTITFYKNHVYYTSGRSPALSGNTIFHAVNNVWESNSGHLIEGNSNGRGLYEGNHFTNVPDVAENFTQGQLFSSEPAYVSQCNAVLKRNCVQNSLVNSGRFARHDLGALSGLSGRTLVAAEDAISIRSTVPSLAGNTLG